MFYKEELIQLIIHLHNATAMNGHVTMGNAFNWTGSATTSLIARMAVTKETNIAVELHHHHNVRTRNGPVTMVNALH